MGAITAKVFLSGKNPAGDGQTLLNFTADYADGANKEWAKYTPSLSLSMTVLNEVAEQFGEHGAKFTLTFDPAYRDVTAEQRESWTTETGVQFGQPPE